MSDQAFYATDRCLKWGCEKSKLELRGRFWCCPKCGDSYGENPHKRCPPLAESPIAEVGQL